MLDELIHQAFEKLKQSQFKLRSESLHDRKQRILKIRRWIHNNRFSIHKAMYEDLKKPSTEVDAIELFHVLSEIKTALANLENWSNPTKIDAPLTMLGTTSYIRYEPKGVCLIISPWNYPFSLCVGPLVSALAAGNSVIIKPSELTPHVSGILKKMADEIFDNEVVSLFEGGPEVSQQLLKLPFDHIFFTGSPGIGKVVMKAAAENLTSVTLELGGKSPTIITSSANIKDAAQRTAVAKFVNNGQTCLAPDYLLVDGKIAASFIKELINQIKNLFTENDEPFETSKHYARIVNEKHSIRLQELLQDALSKGAIIEYSGKVDLEKHFFHPTIITNVSLASRIMHEEIFGPILPILVYNNLDDVITIINDKPKPLALYIFTNDTESREKVIRDTSSGAVCVNDCAIHFLHHKLPFGGIGNSGMGQSHGYSGFIGFSHPKPVLKQRTGFTSVKPFYPPYTAIKQKIMDLFLRFY